MTTWKLISQNSNCDLFSQEQVKSFKPKYKAPERESHCQKMAVERKSINFSKVLQDALLRNC